MPKTCSNGCAHPVFSKKLCKSCWGREYGKPIRNSALIKRTSIKVNPQSKGDAVVKSALSSLKREIELEAVQNNEYYCAGCGKAQVGLDKSHILAVGYRKDLELLKENIQLLCRNCHCLWESKSIESMAKLLCFSSNLNFIKKWDALEYRKLTNKLNEHNNRYFK